MSNREKMLVSMKMIEMGIAPFTESIFFSGVENEIDHALESLSPEERRKAKRKFRKIYKKAYKKLGISPAFTSTKPTSSEIRRRRAAVHRMIMSDLERLEIT